MKKIFLIEDSFANKISWYHLLAFVATLPFDRFYSHVVLISFTIHSLIHIRRGVLKNILSRQVFILSSVFLVTLLATLYSPEKMQGLKDAEKQLAILLFPVLFSITSLSVGKYKMQLLFFFAAVCCVTVLYLWFDAFRIIGYYHLPLKTLFTPVFINQNFSSPIRMHATYLSMYAGLSFIVVLDRLLRLPRDPKKALYGVCLLVLGSGLIQLSSRAVLLALLIIILLGFPWFILKGAKRIRFLIVAVLVTTFAGACIMKLDAFKKRYVSSLRDDLTQISINNEILEPRIVRWKVALELVARSPMLGYGSGTEKKILSEKYFEKKMYNSFLNKLDAHNQYISIMLKAGIIGLLTYCYLLFYGFKNAIRNADIHFFSFLTLATVVSVSENILEVNKGIFFVAFFFSFFIFSEVKQYAKEATKNEI